MRTPVYLDYAATTPVDPHVAQAMMECLTLEGNFGNPASRSHLFGWRAEEAVEQARSELAELIGADPREIVWTSGATESDNLALKGAIEALRDRGAEQPLHLITSAIEHKAVLDTCRALEAEGVNVTYLQPNEHGVIEPEALAHAFTAHTVLVSLMLVNNEIGSINPIRELAQMCRARGILFHCDAAQAVGKLAIDVRELGVDMLSISAHKFYGPKGVGALYVRRTNDFAVAAQIHGGGHERKMRSGTLATHQIVGLGSAAKIAQQRIREESTKTSALKRRFWHGISALDGVQLNGSLDKAAGHIINVQFNGIDGETLMMTLRELAISSGSACTSASLEPSYVLTAVGVQPEAAQSSLRFSFGRFSTEEDIDFAIEKIKSACTSLQALAKQA